MLSNKLHKKNVVCFDIRVKIFYTSIRLNTVICKDKVPWYDSEEKLSSALTFALKQFTIQYARTKFHDPEEKNVCFDIRAKTVHIQNYNMRGQSPMTLRKNVVCFDIRAKTVYNTTICEDKVPWSWGKNVVCFDIRAKTVYNTTILWGQSCMTPIELSCIKWL